MYEPILSQKNVSNFVEICAWCDADKKITKEYHAHGYKTSHGICKKHLKEAIEETKEFYEKNGCIFNDDRRVDDTTSVQHD